MSSKHDADLIKDLREKSPLPRVITNKLVVPRQIQVAECIAEGLSVEEIQETLGLNAGAVRQSTKEIYRRLGIHGNDEEQGVNVRTAFLIASHGPIKESLIRDFSDASGLTKRETDVLRWALQGLKKAEIGEKVGMSCHTVREYIQRIFKKTDINSVQKLFLAVARYKENFGDKEQGNILPEQGRQPQDALVYVL